MFGIKTSDQREFLLRRYKYLLPAIPHIAMSQGDYSLEMEIKHWVEGYMLADQRYDMQTVGFYDNLISSIVKEIKRRNFDPEYLPAYQTYKRARDRESGPVKDPFKYPSK